jgi:tetratricopeptide (TPR) repeat protein
LNRENFFTHKLDHPKPVYRYHPLFREFLHEQAMTMLDDSERQYVQRAAAQVLVEEGQPEKAAELYADAGDWEGLTRLIMSQAQSLAGQGRFGTLEGWLKGLPGEILENTPWLLYWAGMCRLPVEQRRSREYFERAFTGFDALGDATGVLLAWSGVVEAILIGFEDFKLLDRWIEALPDLMDRHGGAPSVEVETAVSASMYNALVMRHPRDSFYAGWQERALALTEASQDINLRIRTLSHYHFDCINRGNAEKGAWALEKMKKVECSEGLPPLARITILFSEAIQYNCSAETGKCGKAVERGLELARKSGVHVYDFLLLGQAARLFIGEMDPASAGEYLRQMEEALGTVRPWDEAFYYHIKAFFALENGDTRMARQYAERSCSLSLKVGNPFTNSLTHLTVAQALSDIGDYSAALEHVREASRLNGQLRSRYLDTFSLLTEAQICFGMGDEGRGLQSLGEAMALGAEIGMVNNIIWRSSVMAELCVRALEAGIEVEYVQYLIRRRGLVPDSSPLHVENWPWALRIYTLGRFSVVSDGMNLSTSGKQQRKPLEMLKALVALGGRDVREESLTDILWPEAEGDVAHRAFNATAGLTRGPLSGGCRRWRSLGETLQTNACRRRRRPSTFTKGLFFWRMKTHTGR